MPRRPKSRRANFKRAAKACKGKSQKAFRKCMSKKLKKTR